MKQYVGIKSLIYPCKHLRVVKNIKYSHTDKMNWMWIPVLRKYNNLNWIMPILQEKLVSTERQIV